MSGCFIERLILDNKERALRQLQSWNVTVQKRAADHKIRTMLNCTLAIGGKRQVLKEII